jgi:hypothetical protein
MLFCGRHRQRQNSVRRTSKNSSVARNIMHPAGLLLPGASLARCTVNLPLVDRQIRFRLPGRFVVNEAYGASGAVASEMFGFGRDGLAACASGHRALRPRLFPAPSPQPGDLEQTHSRLAVTAFFLVSAIQISCSARLALVCRLFGILFRMLAVLCTQQRCSRLSATPRRAPSRTRARHRRPQSAAPLSDRDASNRAADHATIVSSRACHR